MNKMVVRSFRYPKQNMQNTAFLVRDIFRSFGKVLALFGIVRIALFHGCA